VKGFLSIGIVPFLLEKSWLTRFLSFRNSCSIHVLVKMEERFVGFVRYVAVRGHAYVLLTYRDVKNE